MAEETSSVAASMTSQATALTDLIALFRIRENGPSHVVPLPVALPAKPAAPRPVAVAPAPARVKKAVGSDVEWQEF